jgi:hypothetical protein
MGSPVFSLPLPGGGIFVVSRDHAPAKSQEEASGLGVPRPAVLPGFDRPFGDDRDKIGCHVMMRRART